MADVPGDVWSAWYKYKMLLPEQKYGFDYETAFRAKIPKQLYLSDVNELSNIRDSMDAAKRSADKKGDPLSSTRSLKKQIDEAAKSNGYVPSDSDKAKPPDVQKYVTLTLDIENDINDEEKKLKRKLTAEERQPFIDANVIQGTIKQPWYMPDTKRLEFETTTAKRGSEWLPAPVGKQMFIVPPTERDKIVAKRRRRGEPISEDGIREDYYDMLLEIRARTHNP
jgi:hypothetical protein